MTTENKILREFKRLKNLKSYQNKTDDEIKSIAEAKILEQEALEGLALIDDDEKKEFIELWRKYKEAYHLTSPSDKEVLKQICYWEILHRRVQKQLAKVSNNGVINLDSHTIKSLDSIQNQIVALKDKVGLFKRKESQDWFQFWEELYKRVQAYAETHRGECTTKCPKCGHYYLILKKVDDCSNFEFKWFKGTILYNEKLMSMVEDGRMTKEEVAEVFGCSPDYIDIVYNEIYLIEKHYKQHQSGEPSPSVSEQGESDVVINEGESGHPSQDAESGESSSDKI